jgi:hypothetical protein
MKRAITAIFSFEFVFVLFLFAGRYKNDPMFDWVPVDLTLLFLVVSFVCAIWVFIRRRLFIRRQALRLYGVVLLLFGYITVSYFWTPSTVYSIEKIAYILILTQWPFMAALFIVGYDGRRVKRFMGILVIISVWFIIETIIAFQSSEIVGQQISTLGTKYLGIGRVIGPAAIFLAMYGVAIGQSTLWRGAALFTFGVSMVTLLLLGGRGPFLATVVPLLFPLYFGFRLNILSGRIQIKRYVYILLILIVFGFLSVISLGNIEVLTTVKRLVGMASGLGGSASIRLEMYSESISIWMSNPVFGGGVGSWPLLTGRGDYKMYPHNMILEVLSEYGFVGFLLFVCPFAYSFNLVLQKYKLGDHPWMLTIILIFSNTFINAMLSGDIPDNRIVFVFLGLLLARTENFHSLRNSRRLNTLY